MWLCKNTARVWIKGFYLAFGRFAIAQHASQFLLTNSIEIHVARGQFAPELSILNAGSRQYCLWCGRGEGRGKASADNLKGYLPCRLYWALGGKEECTCNNNYVRKGKSASGLPVLRWCSSIIKRNLSELLLYLWGSPFKLSLVSRQIPNPCPPQQQ